MIEPQTARPRERWRVDLVFFVLSVGLSLFVFGGAFTGRSLLAPLDLPANFYSQYRWLDTNANGIPQNHYLVDVFDHELPRQYLMWQGLRHGEFPWWDPYTDNGRPLAAEGHIGGTDPVRLALYCVLPFEWAYNWSKIVSCLLFGLGAYLLLRSQNFPGWICVACALAYQFASDHVLFQTPLCVSSTFAYYALLWWAWVRMAAGFRWWRLVVAGLLCACIVMAGNQQTHAYLAIFTFCFAAGYRPKWGQVLAVFGSVLLGCLLALPVLTAQVELFFLCQRNAALSGSLLRCMTGVANGFALFPWLLGTFRTLDLGRVFQQAGLGFSLYPGTAVLILAAGGAAVYLLGKTVSGLMRTALLLVAAYEIVCLTPLINVLYIRASDLAVLGVSVSCAYALNRLVAGQNEAGARKLMRVLCLACLSAFVAVNLFAFAVLPRIEGKLQQFVLERDRHNLGLPPVPEFRRFQVANLKREISVLNLETVAAAASALGLWWLLRSRDTSTGGQIRFWQVVLALNLVPLLLFARRFTPHQPVELWHRLVQENSEQTRLAASLGLQYRFQEPDRRFAMIYPGAVPGLYRVHATGGYTSFPLPRISEEIRIAGLGLVESDTEGFSPGSGSTSEAPVLTPPSSGASRFQWESGAERSVKVVAESLNRVSIEVAPGRAGTLVRTDRYYPGWEVSEPRGLPVKMIGRWLMAVEVPAEQTRITFCYRPRFIFITGAISMLGLAACLITGLWESKSMKTVKQDHGGQDHEK